MAKYIFVCQNEKEKLTVIVDEHNVSLAYQKVLAVCDPKKYSNIYLKKDKPIA